MNSNIYTIKSEYTVKQLDYICNPFTGPPGYRYRPENCASGAATIGDIPQVNRQAAPRQPVFQEPKHLKRKSNLDDMALIVLALLL